MSFQTKIRSLIPATLALRAPLPPSQKIIIWWFQSFGIWCYVCDYLPMFETIAVPSSSTICNQTITTVYNLKIMALRSTDTSVINH